VLLLHLELHASERWLGLDAMPSRAAGRQQPEARTEVEAKRQGRSAGGRGQRGGGRGSGEDGGSAWDAGTWDTGNWDLAGWEASGEGKKKHTRSKKGHQTGDEGGEDRHDRWQAKGEDLGDERWLADDQGGGGGWGKGYADRPSWGSSGFGSGGGRCGGGGKGGGGGGKRGKGYGDGGDYADGAGGGGGHGGMGSVGPVEEVDEVYYQGGNPFGGADYGDMWGGWQSTAVPEPTLPLMPPLWTEYETEDGQKYYYNSRTGLTQWDRPPELDPPRPPSPPTRTSAGEGLSSAGGGGEQMQGPGRARTVGDTGRSSARPAVQTKGGDGSALDRGPRGEGRHEREDQDSGTRRSRDGGRRDGDNSGRNRRRGGARSEESSGNLLKQKKEGSDFGPPGCNLFIFHLPDDWTDDDLHEYFAPHGNVVSAKVMKELGTGRSRGFGFVSYEDRVSAATALKKMQGYKILGKRLKVEFKKGEGESNTDTDDLLDLGEAQDGATNKKSYPDDERLIGYLRAISAKNVVQSLKESEDTARPGGGEVLRDGGAAGAVDTAGPTSDGLHGDAADFPNDDEDLPVPGGAPDSDIDEILDGSL